MENVSGDKKSDNEERCASLTEGESLLQTRGKIWHGVYSKTIRARFANRALGVSKGGNDGLEGLYPLVGAP
jgi:hypothetical protein